jgi:hypothetical protein
MNQTDHFREHSKEFLLSEFVYLGFKNSDEILLTSSYLSDFSCHHLSAREHIKPDRTNNYRYVDFEFVAFYNEMNRQYYIEGIKVELVKAVGIKEEVEKLRPVQEKIFSIRDGPLPTKTQMIRGVIHADVIQVEQAEKIKKRFEIGLSPTSVRKAGRDRKNRPG